MDFSKEISELHKKIHDAIVNTPNWLYYFAKYSRIREHIEKEAALSINSVGSSSINVTIEVGGFLFEGKIVLSSFESTVEENYKIYSYDTRYYRIQKCKEELKRAKLLVIQYEDKLKRLENETV